MKTSWLHWKRGSLNISVDSTTHSILALRTFVSAFVSNELLPKTRVFIKTGSERSRRLLSIFSVVLRSTSLSNIHGTIDSINEQLSKPQLQNWFKEPW